MAVHTSQSSEEVQTRLSTVQRLRVALENEGLVVERQPIRDLQTGTVATYELLVRLITEDGQHLQPAGFLPVAERTGLIRHIDRWVAAHAIKLLSDGSHEGLSLAVNLSARSLTDDELPDWVHAQIADAGIEPGRLIFELTETAVIANMELAANLAAQLRALGCRFVLDDFGAGFGSFYYLKHLPLDAVKIDGDFIVNLPRDPVSQLVVQAMVDIAAGMGLRTVAEYVQDGETEQLLRSYGVTAGQGFHIGRPEPIPPAEG